MSSLRDRVIVVTGGTSGIGREAAVACGREGAHVVVAGRREKDGHETVRLVREAGGDGAFLACDVADPASVKHLFGTIEERFDRIDAAFNNAGVDEVLGPFQEKTEADYDRIMDVNVKGLWLCLQEEVRAMSRRGRGAIVNNASVAGMIGMPGAAIYVASKHAVIGLTRAAALEFAKSGIRINAVAPAAIETDMYERFAKDPGVKKAIGAMHPIGRIGRAEEVAHAVAWLCSDAASFVTGVVLPIDGGFTAQ